MTGKMVCYFVDSRCRVDPSHHRILICCRESIFMRGSREGDRGFGPPSPENHKNIGFLCNTGPDPLKNHKATKPAFNEGPTSARQRNAI